jgi:N-terminal domain of anti-restriction factor ArdC
MTTATATATTSGTALDWTELMQTVLTMPGSMGQTYCRFYDYSVTNQVLMFMQGLREPVATYKRWQSVGRQVRRGSKARSIIRPITVTRRDDAGDVEATFTRFKVVNCIFPFSDTDGPDVELPELPEWNLTAAALALDIRREAYADLSGNVQGYSYGRTFAVSPCAVHPVKTSIHELAHITLGHTAHDERTDDHRGLREFEAEATAYVVMAEVAGLDSNSWAPDESRAYVQHWLASADQHVSEVNIRRVFSAANKILTAGRPARDVSTDVAA